MSKKIHKLSRNLPFSLLLLLVLLLSFSGVTAFASGDDLSVSVGSASDIAPGASVTLPVSISNNPGFATFGFQISYDSDALTLDSITASSAANAVVSALTAASSTDGTVTYVSPTDETNNGILFDLNFSVKASAASADYTVSIGLIDNAAANFANTQLDPLSAVYSSGTLGVAAATAAASDAVITRDVTGGEAISFSYDAQTHSVVYSGGPIAWYAAGAVSEGNPPSSGNYVGIYVQAPEAIRTLAKTAAAITVNSLNGERSATGLDTDDGFYWWPKLSADAPSASFSVDWDGAGTAYAATAYTVNASECSFAADPNAADNSIDLADFSEGVYAISKAGEYTVAADAAGVISISTTAAVKLSGAPAQTNIGLSIQYTVAEAQLTIEDIRISSPAANVPCIDFTGTGNQLYFSGDNLLRSSGYTAASACIHVGADTALSLDGDGVLSMSMNGGGSCIGGADAAVNGDITINGGAIFGYSSRAGSVIGSGQQVSAEGSITINGGELHLFGKARGSVIGSGGMSSSQIGNGASVAVNGGNITLYVDFTGSAIGNGGGQRSANDLGMDPDPDPGRLSVSGGSIKTIMRANALGFWGLGGEGDQINNIGVTAVKQNADAAAVYLLTLSLEDIAANETGAAYVVTENGVTLYSGSATKNYTVDTNAITWSSDTTTPTDNDLYLYVTGEEHTFVVNGTGRTYIFDDASNSFSLYQAPSYWDGSIDTTWYNSSDSSFTLHDGADLAGLAAIVNGTAEGVEQDCFKGKTLSLANDILLNPDEYLSVTHSGTHGSVITTTVTVDPAAQEFTPIGNGTNAFKGSFDGQGHDIRGLYISQDASFLGLFGAVGGTDNVGEAGYGLVSDFQLYGLVQNTNSTKLATDYVGAVCGILRAGGTISGVINYANVEAPNTANVGGIVGFAGTPVNGAGDGVYTANPSGYNTFVLECGNEATLHGYYKLGGIVGENAATVMYCYNNGWILPHMHGSGGGWGGIAGRNGNNNAATEQSVIAYCYNTAEITNGGKNDDADETIKGYGGIVGMGYGAKGDNEIYNCYNIGTIAPGRNNYNSIASGTEGLCSVAVRNNYSLISDQIISYSSYEREKGVQVEQAAFKATTYGVGDILTRLGTAFKADSSNINNGYPILRWQVGASFSAALSSIEIVTPPTKTSYNATEIFDPSGMVVLAAYADGTKAIVSDRCSYSSEGLVGGATSISISFSEGDVTKTAEQAITVSGLVLESISITTAPAKTVYVNGDVFDATGMVVTASYNGGAVNNEVAAGDYSVTSQALSITDSTVSVSYTFEGVTKSVTQAVLVMDAYPQPDTDGYYLLEDANDMLWFANRVNAWDDRCINVRLNADIDLSAIAWQPIGGVMTTSFSAKATTAYLGQFDGNNKTVTLGIDSTYNYQGLFAAVGAASVDAVAYSGKVYDLTVAGSVKGGNYSGAVSGYSFGGSFENCLNQATVNCAQAGGGIVGRAENGSSFVNCHNEAVITASGNWSGGIVGYNAGTASYTDCSNSGVLNSTANYCGGVVGWGGAGVFKNCHNSAAISGAAYVAGIAGNVYSANSGVEQCSNSGAITASGSAAAGIAAQVASNNNTYVRQCYNSGAISGSYDVGGIVGNNKAEITDCYNIGDVSGSYTATVVYRATGGVVGYQASAVAMSNVFSSGTVSGQYSGAIMGSALATPFELSNAYYLEGSSDKAYGERTAGKVIATNVAAKSAAQISSLAATLGANFKDGFSHPILTWQPDELIKTTPVTSGSSASVSIPTTSIGEVEQLRVDAKVAETVTKTEVTLPATGIDGLSTVVIDTNVGAVEFDAAALAGIVSAAGSNDVVLSIEAVSDPTSISDTAAKNLIESGGKYFDLSLTANGEEIFSHSQGTATVTLSYDLSASQSVDNLNVYHISGNSKTALEFSYVDGQIVTELDGFSGVGVEYATAITSGIDLGDTAYYLAGNTVSATLKLTADQLYNASMIELDVYYDASKLSFDSMGSVADGFEFADISADGANYVKLVYSKLVEGDQVPFVLPAASEQLLVTLKFTVKTDAAAGVSTLRVQNGLATTDDGNVTETAIAASSSDLNLFGLTATLEEYTGAATGQKLLKLSGDKMDEFYVRFGEDDGMFWSPAYNSYVMFTVSPEVATALTSVSFAAANAQLSNAILSYSGDVNLDGRINIIDIQLAYDILKGTSKVADNAMRLRADVNDTFGVDIADVQKLLLTVLHREGGVGYEPQL